MLRGAGRRIPPDADRAHPQGPALDLSGGLLGSRALRLQDPPCHLTAALGVKRRRPSQGGRGPPWRCTARVYANSFVTRTSSACTRASSFSNRSILSQANRSTSAQLGLVQGVLPADDDGTASRSRRLERSWATILHGSSVTVSKRHAADADGGRQKSRRPRHSRGYASLGMAGPRLERNLCWLTLIPRPHSMRAARRRARPHSVVTDCGYRSWRIR